MCRMAAVEQNEPTSQQSSGDVISILGNVFEERLEKCNTLEEVHAATQEFMDDPDLEGILQLKASKAAPTPAQYKARGRGRGRGGRGSRGGRGGGRKGRGAKANTTKKNRERRRKKKRKRERKEGRK